MTSYITISGQSSIQDKMDAFSQITNKTTRVQWENALKKNRNLIPSKETLVILNNSKASLTFRFDVSAGNYYITLRCIAPTSRTDTASIRLDANPRMILNLKRTSNQSINKVSSVILYKNINLTNGSHTLTIGYKEPFGLLSLIVRKQRSNLQIVIPANDMLYRPPIQPVQVVTYETTTQAPEIEAVLVPMETTTGAPSYETTTGAPSYETTTGAPSYETTTGTPSYEMSTTGAPSYETTEEKKTGFPWWLIFLVMFVVLVLIVFFYFYWKHQPQQQQLKQKVVAQLKRELQLQQGKQQSQKNYNRINFIKSAINNPDQLADLVDCHKNIPLLRKFVQNKLTTGTLTQSQRTQLQKLNTELNKPYGDRNQSLLTEWLSCLTKKQQKAVDQTSIALQQQTKQKMVAQTDISLLRKFVQNKLTTGTLTQSQRTQLQKLNTELNKPYGDRNQSLLTEWLSCLTKKQQTSQQSRPSTQKVQTLLQHLQKTTTQDQSVLTKRNSLIQMCRQFLNDPLSSNVDLKQINFAIKCIR